MTATNVEKIPCLNTPGLSMPLLHFTSCCLTVLHTHPWDTEIIFVLKGKLDAGVITMVRNLISETVKKGGMFG